MLKKFEKDKIVNKFARFPERFLYFYQRVLWLLYRPCLMFSKRRNAGPLIKNYVNQEMAWLIRLVYRIYSGIAAIFHAYTLVCTLYRFPLPLLPSILEASHNCLWNCSSPSTLASHLLVVLELTMTQPGCRVLL